MCRALLTGLRHGADVRVEVLRNYFRYLVRSLLLALVLLGVSVGDTQARVGGQTETYGSISGSETLPGQTLAAVTKAKKKRKKRRTRNA